MNEVIKAMIGRRSCRKYRADKIPKLLIEEIAEAGLYAASGRNKQAVKIVAVTDKALRDRLSEMNREIGGWEAGFDPSSLLFL